MGICIKLCITLYAYMDLGRSEKKLKNNNTLLSADAVQV